ncbi:DUF167 domain-containing protein [Falsirhodobacter sp. alg1]|uniref:DUF167 domain-containing protein n=1 Tax=Falsirhodobacter sp. alg1 TaxID=1472418 RepID=UPI001EDB319B|nr:DUF167 domain-containing protein [Falsirhodobacter sp. alg1]
MGERLINVRVQPRASRNKVDTPREGALRIYVTAPPEGGRATDAARTLLAKHLGCAPSRLELVRGATSREKTFRVLE